MPELKWGDVSPEGTAKHERRVEGRGSRAREGRKPSPHGYQVGDMGAVLKVLKNPTGGDNNFYVVAMDKNHLVGGGMAFSEEEIEPDI